MTRFLVSAGRAGSTFVARCLNLHQSVVCLLESHHLPLMIDAFGNDEASPEDLIAVFESARFHNARRIINFNLEQLQIPPDEYSNWKAELMRKSSKLSMPEFQSRLERFFLNATGATIFIDKTPCYGCFVELIQASLRPKSFTLITRDVLPSIKSMARHPGFRIKLRSNELTWTDVLRFKDIAAIDAESPLDGQEMVAMAELWAHRTAEPVRQARRVGVDMAQVHYEDLVANSRAFFSRLAELLELPNADAWVKLSAAQMVPSATPTTYESAPHFAALQTRPTVREARLLTGYLR